MPTVWIVLVLVVILVAAFALVREEDPFKAAATSLNLKLTRSVPDLLPHLEGIINGLPVKIDIAQRTEPVVRYRVFYPDLGMALKLERETNITRTLGQLGEQDTQVGARAFDASFRVNTSRPDTLREMMTPDLRRTLERLIERYPKMVIEDGQMTLLGDSMTPTADAITDATIQMAAAAHMLTERRPPPLEKPASTRPAPSAAAPPPVAAQPVDEPTPERSLGPESADAVAPDKAQQPQPQAKQQPSVAPEPTPPATGLPDGFFEDAFGANRLSFESDNRFEDELKGKPVTLEGTIKQARDQEGDTDFASGAVTKAIIRVAQIDNDLYGKTDIDAVVYLPAGSADELERGDKVTFTGTLEQVDAFMRNLFITDAEIAG